MQIVSCVIAQGGDENTQVVRDAERPVSFPEVLLLAHLHGKSAVRDIRYLHDEDREDDDERERLTGIYGAAAVQAVFGTAGVQPLPKGDPRLVKQAAKEKAAKEAAAQALAAMEAQSAETPSAVLE